MNESYTARKALRDVLEFQFYARLFASCLMLIILLGVSVYAFIMGNREVIIMVTLSLFVLIASITILVVTTRTIKNARLKRVYINSLCYKEYGKPFQKEYRMPYYQYQFELYEKITESLKGSVFFDVVLAEQEYLTSDISIDLILFHSSGIYAVQTLAYDGPLKGKLDERVWTPYFYLGVKKALTIDQKLWLHWKKSNSLSNPIMQTDLYSKNLKKYLPNYQIKGVSICHDKMIDQSFDHLGERLFSFEDFIQFVKKQPVIYQNDDLLQASKIIKSVSN